MPLVWGIARIVLVQWPRIIDEAVRADVKLAATVSPSTSSSQAQTCLIVEYSLCCSFQCCSPSGSRSVSSPNLLSVRLAAASPCLELGHVAIARIVIRSVLVTPTTSHASQHSLTVSCAIPSSLPVSCTPRLQRRVISSATAHTLMLPASVGCSTLSPPSSLRHCNSDLTHPV